MKIETLVASALFIVAFLIGSIFLINFLKASVFVYLYFIFSFVLLIGIGLSLRKAYPEQVKILFLMIPILLIALALTFFGTSIKAYSDKSKEINGNLDLNSQILNLEKTNEYYTTYISFLNDEISKAKQASLDLQSQINDLTSQRNLNAQVPNTTQETTPIIINREDDEREEDD